MLNRGATLIELMVYMAIVAVLSGLFIGILGTSARVQVREVASNEVSNQANFVLQTIQRLIRESSNVEAVSSGNNPDTTASEIGYLKLRMKDSGSDPTCISLVDVSGTGAITITQGPQDQTPGSPGNAKCKEPNPATQNIITNKVTISLSPPGLTFTKSANPPGHDLVQIDLSLTASGVNPAAQVPKVVRSAVGRVSAATFDSSLIPAGVGSFDIGSSGTPWQNLFVDGTITQSGNYPNNGSRGQLIVGANEGDICNNICQAHLGSGSSCAKAFKLEFSSGTNIVLKGFSGGCGAQINSLQDYGGVCFCQNP